MQINNIKCAVLLLAGAALAAFLFWLFFQPVEIVAVHHRSNNYSAILVKNFPLTDKGKINWWLNNRAMIKEKYNIPYPDKKGFFSVVVWPFGEGYKKDMLDDNQYCFDDMKSDKNCIEKNAIFIIGSSRGNQAYFSVDNGEYILKNNGDIIKTKSE